MKSHLTRFLHHTLSYLGGKPDTASSLSYSDLIGVSRSNQVANLFHLDYRVKPDNDSEGADYRVKPDNDSVCAGRSMVEMLGVLAIIGVLSVGAIAGYSKAMMKYKLNKQAEQISWLLNVMYRYRNNFGKRFMHLVPYFVKLGEIPENMIKDNSLNIYDIFGSAISIAINGCSSEGICYSIVLAYQTTSSASFESCQNLTNIAKEFHDELRTFNVARRKTGVDTEYAEAYKGTKFCINDKHCIRDITQEQIYELCRYCRNDDIRCNIYYSIPIN